MATQSSEAREAAERLRSLTYRGMGDWRTPSGERLDDEDVNELKTELAGAWLTDNPADDDEAITAEWIVSIGAKATDHKDKFRFYRSEYAVTIGLWSVSDGWKAMLEHREEWATCIVRGLKTRGAVRRLASALGIQLKELPCKTAT